MSSHRRPLDNFPDNHNLAGPTPHLALSDALGQLGLARLGPGEASDAPGDNVIVLKARNNGHGPFYALEDHSYGNTDFSYHSSPGNLIVVLADENYLHPPSQQVLRDLFSHFKIPVRDYMDMIASFFPTQIPVQTPTRLRPTLYPEPATDLRFPKNSYSIRGTTWDNHEVCFKLYIVDTNPSSKPTTIPYANANGSSAIPLVTLPRIHKCAALVQPQSDRIIVTTTFRNISSDFSGIQYPAGEFSTGNVLIPAAQYVLAELGSTGWDICLDSIESSAEGLLKEASGPHQEHEDQNGRRQIWDGLLENLTTLQRCCYDIVDLMQANRSIMAAMEDIESAGTYSPSQGHMARRWRHVRSKLIWQMERVANIEKALDLEMNRVTRKCQAEQESKSRWIAMSSLKILFVFRAFSHAVAYVLLIFLPAIFVSTLCSTWFLGPDGADIAHELWIFFVILVPLTLLVVVITGSLYRLSSGSWSVKSFNRHTEEPPITVDPPPPSTASNRARPYLSSV